MGSSFLCVSCSSTAPFSNLPQNLSDVPFQMDVCGCIHSVHLNVASPNEGYPYAARVHTHTSLTEKSSDSFHFWDYVPSLAIDTSALDPRHLQAMKLKDVHAACQVLGKQVGRLRLLPGLAAVLTWTHVQEHISSNGPPGHFSINHREFSK